MNQDTASVRAALAANPQQPELWYCLAQRESRAGQYPAAAALLREGLRHCPDQPDLLYLLGNSLHHGGAPAEAIAAYRRCVARAPHITEALIELPLALLRVEQFAEAETAARVATQAAPENAEAHINLGTVLCRRHRYVAGLACLARAMALAPRNARAHNQAGLAHLQLGQAKQAVARFEQALALQPGYALAHGNLALARLYVPLTEQARQHAGQHSWRDARRHARQSPAPAARPRRIGFVSGDLHQHVVALFLLPLFAQHDRRAFEFHVYNTGESRDSWTDELARHVCAWHDVCDQSDAALAQKIAADRIDVLIDLAGHTAGNRLALFALRPAPMQASWLGYPGIVDMPGIDYRITDGVLDPPDAAAAGETTLRLPHVFFCYTPPAAWGGTLAVSALPAAASGYVRFGAFNDMAKVSAPCAAAWAAVLDAVPGSRLTWRARCFEEAAARESWLDRFDAMGIARGRVQLAPYDGDPARHMAAWSGIDIHLDTFPYTGGTTTCDALWHGVPVVTLADARPSERLAASVLSCIGRAEWIAHSEQEYVAIAASLARDPVTLARWRTRLRGMVAASPLHDGAGFARAFENLIARL